MKNIIFARVDDRLIHGQVVTEIVPTHKINHIIIVDDITASDGMQRRILKALAPSGVQVSVHSIESATENLKRDFNSKERVLVLAKTPIAFKELHENGIPFKEINIGGMGTRDDRSVLIKNVGANKEEREAIKKLLDSDIDVYYQLVPEQKKYELSAII
jgi:PTS system mannose-specific IIB component